MASNVRKFNAELRHWAKVMVPESHLAFTKKIAEVGFRRIVQRTPQDRSEAIAGWRVQLHSGAGGLGIRIAGLLRGRSTQGSLDPDGEATIAAGVAKIQQAKFGQTIVFANPVPHTEILEYGGFVPPDPGPSKRGGHDGSRKGQILVSGGFSTQAPEGMVRKTLDELRAEFRRAR